MSKDFIHPLIYTGPKVQKDMSHMFPGRTLIFAAGPLSEQPGPLEGKAYADVTEQEGRRLCKQFPELFKWPEGVQFGPQVVSREEYDALKDQVEAMAEVIEGILDKIGGYVREAKEAEPTTGKKKSKAKEAEPTTEPPVGDGGE